MKTSFLLNQWFIIGLLVAMSPEIGVSKDLLPPQLAEEANVTSRWIKSHLLPVAVNTKSDGKAMREEHRANWNLYWSKLRALGDKVDRETGELLQKAKELSVEEEITLIAYEHAQSPERLEEILALYSVPRQDISYETFNRYFPNNYTKEFWLRHNGDPKMPKTYRSPIAAPSLPLDDKHKQPIFRTTWEALMIAPISDMTDRLTINTFSKLGEIGTKQTAELGLFRMQTLAEAQLPPSRKLFLAKSLYRNFQYCGTPKEVIEWWLRGLSIAEIAGFAAPGSESRNLYYTLHLLLTYPGDDPSDERHKVYIPVVRDYDLSKLPISQQQVLKKAIETYDGK